jgi:hypothetical protein
MTESTLKLVILFDSETSEYKPSAHNLAADQAIDHVQSFTAEGRKSQIVDQDQRHRSSNPRKCKACQNAAVEATRKQDDVSREDQDEQKPAHDPGDANDLD